MTEIQIAKEIVKANIVTEIYKDSTQPAVRVLGKSLAQCVSLFTSPIGRTAEIFEKNVNRYLDKLNKFTDDEIISPDVRVLVPVLERLRYTDDEKVADYYAEILATASIKDQSKKVMVSFIEILNRLSADEINMLEYINSDKNTILIENPTEEEIKNLKIDPKSESCLVSISGGVPVVSVQVHSKITSGYIEIDKNLNSLNSCINLFAPENIDVYIDNLISLGLLEKSSSQIYSVQSVYKHLEESDYIKKIKEGLTEDQDIKFKKGRIDLTNLCLKLLDVCVNKNK